MNLTFLRRLLAMGLLFVMMMLTLPVFAGAQQASHPGSRQNFRVRISKTAARYSNRTRAVRTGYYYGHRRWHHRHHRHRVGVNIHL